MAKVLSKTFRSLKPHSPNPKPSPNPNSKSPMQLQLSPCNSSSSPSTKSNSISISTQKQSSWSVYLIISTNPPIKTYVGVTTNFSRRLKQHNGERKGGAKASRAGRPWICACIIRGFKDQSQACEFEWKWKNLSKRLPRKRKSCDSDNDKNNGALLLLQHRQAALNKVRDSFDFSRLEIDWQVNRS